jgi:hypothetical protein
MKNNNGNSCSCVEDFILHVKRNHVQINGLGIVFKPDGSTHKGFLTQAPSIVMGGRKRTMMLAFRFCPFCGKKLESNTGEIGAKTI